MKVFHRGIHLGSLQSDDLFDIQKIELVKALDRFYYQPVDSPEEAEMVLDWDKTDMWKMLAWKVNPEEISFEQQLIAIDSPDFSDAEVEEIISRNEGSQICIVSPHKIENKKKGLMYLENASHEELESLSKFIDVFFTRTLMPSLLGYGISFVETPCHCPYIKLPMDIFCKLFVSRAMVHQ